MPSLSNARHERFAQGLAKGKTADEAYQEAGYKQNRHNAAALGREQHISTRVAELQERGAIRVELTIADILDELEQARKIALRAATPQAGAAVTATMGKAKLLGLVTDRSELSGPNGAPIPITEFKRTIIDPQHRDTEGLPPAS